MIEIHDLRRARELQLDAYHVMFHVLTLGGLEFLAARLSSAELTEEDRAEARCAIRRLQKLQAEVRAARAALVKHMADVPPPEMCDETGQLSESTVARAMLAEIQSHFVSLMQAADERNQWMSSLFGQAPVAEG